MKKITLFVLSLVLALGVFSTVWAADVTIGTDTTTQRQPFGAYWGYERSASLYLSSEIGYTGTITQLQWYVGTAQTTSIPTVIYLKTTANTTLTADTWANMISGATQVYSATRTYTPTGWLTIDITDFNYTSGNLLVLCATNYGGTGTGTYPYFRYSTTTGYNRHEYWYQDSSAPTGNGTPNTSRPNITISITTSGIANPTAFTATAASSTQINLGWTRNATPDNVLLAWNTTNTFGTPSGSYTAGNTITGGGTVLLANSSATSYNHTGRDPNTTYYYKIWSQNGAGPTYSTGVTANATTQMAPITTFPWTENLTGVTTGTIPTGWTQTGASAHWSAQATNNAGGTSPEFRFYWSPGETSTFRLITPQLDGSVGALQLSFKHLIDYYATPATYAVQYTTNGGSSWTPLWSAVDPPANVGPTTQVVDLSTINTVFQLAWVYDGNSYNTDNWYVDDISVSLAIPAISISETSWDYGLAFVNDSSCTTRQFTATNIGGGTLTIASGGVTLTGSGAAQFDLTDPNTYPINLTAGQSASWTVKFDPTSAGEKKAYLSIVDNTGAKYVIGQPSAEKSGGTEILKANSLGTVPAGSGPKFDGYTPSAGVWQPDAKEAAQGSIKHADALAALPAARLEQRELKAKPTDAGEQILASNPFVENWFRGTTNISLRGFGVEEVYEDYFDTYTDFSLSFTPWTQDDNDASATYSITNVTFTNQGYTGSYIIFNPASTSPALTTGYEPYSGAKYAACFDATTPPNDDWLISPQMTFGKYPRISFFAKSVTATYGLERFKVLYSTDATNWYYLAGDATNYISAPVDWTLYEYPVPGLSSTNGYIAIQCVSNDAFIFMVDDFVAGSTDYVYAVQGGYWSDPNTWSTGVVPDSADDVFIPDGVTVIVDSDRVTYSPAYDGQYDYENQANAGSLTVEDGGELILDSEAVLLVLGDVSNSGTITWNAGSSNQEGYNTLLFVQGDFTNTSTGTIDCSAVYCDLYFSGDAAQVFTNNGAVTGLITTLDIENVYGVTLAGSNQIPVARVNLFTGQVTNASQLTLGSSGTAAVVQIGNLEQDNPAGSFDEIPTYAEGCYIELLYASGNADYSTGYEVPADGIIDFMLVYMNSGTQYDLTLSQDIYISGAFDSDEMEDEVLFNSGRLYFNGYALVYNAESFYISGQGADYVDDFAVEINKATQYDVDGTGDGYTFLYTWETYGTQSGGVDLSFYNPTEWTSAVPTVDAYYSDDGGLTWTLYQADATVTNGLVTLTDVTALGSTTQTRIWAFYNEEEPLPIELSSFTATISAQNFINLTWVTQSETGVQGYYVLRNTSADLATALTVSDLIAATNTSQQQSYVFTDKELAEDGTYYYWLQNSDLDGTVAFHGPISIVYSAAGGNIPSIPLVTELKAIYPNPFNPLAFFPYSLKESATVNFEIYNSRGQLVRRIPIGEKSAGYHQTEWDGRDDQGRACSTGVYHIRMTAGTESFFRKAVLMK